MADAAVVPQPSVVSRAATAVVAGASSAASATLSFLSVPAIGTCLTLIVGGLVTWGGLAVKAHYDAPHLVITAADPPKPTPIESTATLDHLLGIHADKLSGDIKAEIAALRVLIDERIPAPASKVAPSRVRALPK